MNYGAKMQLDSIQQVLSFLASDGSVLENNR